MTKNNLKCKLHDLSLKLKMNNIGITVSNILAVLCIIATVIATINPEVYIFWLNNFFYVIWDYPKVFLQFFTSVFLHWDFLHLIMNMIFLVYFGNIVEEMIWKKKFFLFFLFIVFFEWIAILYLWEWNTVWISWFNLAILTYYALKLYDVRHPEFQSAMTVIVINVLLWFAPWISLLWHFFWSLWGIIFYYLLNKNLPFEFDIDDFYKK